MTHVYAYQAREILYSYYPQDSKSGSFKTSKKPDTVGLKREGWTKGKSVHADASDRDARYLAAYVEIARQAKRDLWASGIPLDDEFLWFDRAVMNTLLTQGYIDLNEAEERFKLTERGNALVHTLPKPPSKERDR